MKKVSFIFGTRPEAIKLCPLILAMKEYHGLKPHVCVTAQHREMLDQVLKTFEIKPDVDLSIMQENQSLSSLTSRAMTAIDSYLADFKPDLVIVQGDTTTTLSASLTAYYHKIPIGHVEAGLRTWKRYSPFPEEMNRVITSHLSDYHFAPTVGARTNLLIEGVDPGSVFVTGNTGIDALHMALKKNHDVPPVIPGLPMELVRSPKRPLILITCHRRESFGRSFDSICEAIRTLAIKFENVDFVYPVHLNPNARKPVFKILTGHRNIHLIAPLDYLPLVALIERSKLVLTDSGGIQEEAPSLGKPVLVMRETTERPEAVKAGNARLVGTDRSAIVDEVSMLLTDKQEYSVMSNAVNPYGDGLACERILKACLQILNGRRRSV